MMSRKIICEECGTEYDGQMTSCPSCGNIASSSKRKTLISALVIIVVLLVCIAGGAIYLYIGHEAWKDGVAEQKRQEQVKDSLERMKMIQIAINDIKNSERVKAEREKAINQMDAACEKRERATKIRTERELAEFERRLKAEREQKLQEVREESSFANEINKNEEMVRQLLPIEAEISRIERGDLDRYMQRVLSFRRQNAHRLAMGYPDARKDVRDTCKKLINLYGKAVVITHNYGRKELLDMYAVRIWQLNEMIEEL